MQIQFSKTIITYGNLALGVVALITSSLALGQKSPAPNPCTCNSGKSECPKPVGLTQSGSSSGGYSSYGYPNKPIRIIVPFAAGGGADILARLIAQRLGERLGQPVVIDNRGGAGGIVGTELAAHSPPDGYTLIMGSSVSHGTTPALYRKLSYDVIEDFEPIVLVAAQSYLLAVHPSIQANSVKDLVSLARANPGKIQYGSAGNGSLSHLTSELFKKMAGIDLTHIPYKGGSPVIPDLVGGQLGLSFVSPAAGMPQVRAGRLRALAVTGWGRSKFAPEIPTVNEAALPGFESRTWYGVLSPRNTPEAVVTRLSNEISAIVWNREVVERMLANDEEPCGDGKKEFAAHIRAEIGKWTRVVADSGARIE